MITTTFKNGNIEITATIAGEPTLWEAEGRRRAYYDVEFDKKRFPIHKFYEVLEGQSQDRTVAVSGRVFGYVLSCDSNTKAAAATAAVLDLATQIANAQ